VHGDLWTVQARRWAKFPATLLFALSVVWMVCLVFKPAEVVPSLGPKTGVGVLSAVYLLAVIPLGSVLSGIGLLFLQAWAYLPAALLPLWPLVVLSGQKFTRVAGKFSEYHASQDVSRLGDGVIDVLVVLAFWLAYAMALYYLWKSWKMRPQRARGPGPGGSLESFAVAGGLSASMRQMEDGEQCLLLPETDDNGDS
jgi:hypothetical protein